ncbi:hypothetical protein RIB2604_02900070 [Aspergillus luchuensis]|uniref:DASH complex subunit DAD2 n=1 Tax=Aspergillus kawachii TaxID=1069201 RepID=A0A146FTN2_ASPKA|nr:hypothetical protein RIB2604_02900070 [Aspergillus luchuensis]
MAYMSRTASMLPPGSSATSSFRQPNQQSTTISQQQSSVLASRIAAKRAELDNLRQLRDMSAALASQMQALQDKLGTLKDGTEATGSTGISVTRRPGCRLHGITNYALDVVDVLGHLWHCLKRRYWMQKVPVVCRSEHLAQDMGKVVAFWLQNEPLLGLPEYRVGEECLRIGLLP